MSSLKYIANQLNISPITVSRAINKPDLVSPTLREKILSLVDELDYRPNITARSLVTNKTGIIQVVTNLEAAHYYFKDLFMGIADHLSQNDYSIIFSRKPIKNKCDGVIAMSLVDSEKADFVEQARCPCVLFGKGSGLPVDSVDVNNFGGVYMGTRHLIAQGHSKIAYIGYITGEAFTRERLQGYKQCMIDYDKPSYDEWICMDGWNQENLHRSVKEILENSGVTAFICLNDALALIVVDTIKALGLRVPEDISVMGFDGVYEDRLCTPVLTTILQPVQKIGMTLAELMIKRINEPDREKENIIFDLELKQGASVAAKKERRNNIWNIKSLTQTNGYTRTQS